MFVTGVYRAPSAPRPARVGRAAPAFQLPAHGAEEAEAAARAAPVAIPSLLRMQEEQSAALQDRDARRRGSAMIDELQDLQRSLLGADGPSLDRLARLAGPPVAAADLRLAGVLRAIRLRAQIELARHGAAASG